MNFTLEFFDKNSNCVLTTNFFILESENEEEQAKRKAEKIYSKAGTTYKRSVVYMKLSSDTQSIIKNFKTNTDWERAKLNLKEHISKLDGFVDKLDRIKDELNELITSIEAQAKAEGLYDEVKDDPDYDYLNSADSDIRHIEKICAAHNHITDAIIHLEETLNDFE